VYEERASERMLTPPHVVIVGPRKSGKTRFVDAVVHSPREGSWSEAPDERRYRATIAYETQALTTDAIDAAICVTEVANMHDGQSSFHLRHAGVLCYVYDCKKSNRETVIDDLLELVLNGDDIRANNSILVIAVVAVYHLSVEGTATADESDISHIASVLDSTNAKLATMKKKTSTVAQSYLLNTVRSSNARMIFDELVSLYLHQLALRQQTQLEDFIGRQTDDGGGGGGKKEEDNNNVSPLLCCFPLRRGGGRKAPYRKVNDDDEYILTNEQSSGKEEERIGH